MTLGRCPFSIFCSHGTPPRGHTRRVLAILSTFLTLCGHTQHTRPSCVGHTHHTHPSCVGHTPRAYSDFHLSGPLLLNFCSCAPSRLMRGNNEFELRRTLPPESTLFSSGAETTLLICNCAHRQPPGLQHPPPLLAG